MCKWNGNKFERIARDEEQKEGGYSRVTRKEFNEVNGWSAVDQGSFVSPFSFSIEVNKWITLSVAEAIQSRPNYSPRDAIRSQCSTCSKHKRESGNEED
jgi:hypothetical protein